MPISKSLWAVCAYRDKEKFPFRGIAAANKGVNQESVYYICIGLID